MKKILSIALAVVVSLLFAGNALAQSNTSYFMEGSYFRTELNPALAPTRGYIALPGMGGVGLNVSNNFLSVENFFYKRDNQVVTALHGAVTTDEFLGKLPEVGLVDINANVNLLGLGFYTKRTYWNLGINLRSQSDITLSKDIFSLLKTIGNGSYDLSNTSVNSNNYMEVYLGSSFPVCKFVNVGIRAKFLAGLANASAIVDELGADVTPDAVRAQLRGSMRASGVVIDPQKALPGGELSTDFLDVSDVQAMLGRFKSFGVAVDLGTEIRLIGNRLRISAAVTDLGFISWKPDASIIADFKADAYFNGINLETSEVDYDANFEGRFADAPTTAAKTMLRATVNVGVEYAILKNRISFGLLSHSVFGNGAMKYTELTASVNFRPVNWISATFSHTFLNRNKPGILGFAFNLHPAGFNLFVGADYIGTKWVRYENVPIPYDMKSVNVYAGVGFNFGRPKHLKAEKTKRDRN